MRAVSTDAVRCIVLDASVTLALVLPSELRADEASAILDAVEPGALWAPALWCTEVANALVTAHRRQRLSQAGLDEARLRVGLLNITLDPAVARLVLTTIIDLAVQYRLTVYDAAYLELALRLSAGLATFDEALRRAGHAAGVTLL